LQSDFAGAAISFIMTKPIKLTKGPLAGKTVELAPQARTARLEPFVQRVLDALGHPEALVTDESMISDFVPHHDSSGADPENMRWLTTVGRQLGMMVSYQDLIVDIAEQLQGGQ
jgi:hypothetical protein